MYCSSQNVIYKIVCRNCAGFYIGQTGNELCQRIIVHTANKKLRSKGVICK